MNYLKSGTSLLLACLLTVAAAAAAERNGAPTTTTTARDLRGWSRSAAEMALAHSLPRRRTDDGQKKVRWRARS